jgi:hypothetical protein
MLFGLTIGLPLRVVDASSNPQVDACGPGHQQSWLCSTVARELRARIKRAFDDAGIEIPFPHQTVTYRRGDAPPPVSGDDGGAAGGTEGSTPSR